MNFEFQNPTRLIFGAGSLARLGEVVSEHGKKALIVTGGGSIKRSGIFDRAVTSLKDAGISFAQCSGIEPNPRISSVVRGAETARAEGCDVIIALGGGSTIDAAKVIAAAVFYEGDPWDMIRHGDGKLYVPTKALPIIAVPTLAATGSEANSTAVISNEETLVKSSISNKCLYPRVAIVDPELTVSVPKNQTAYGVCDTIIHVTETYFNGIGGTPIQDRFAEGVILTAMEWGPKAIADGTDIEARSQIQWAALVALNGWLQVGTDSSRPVHKIEHTLSAHHDVTHAAGLSAVNQSWMRFAAKARPERFVQFAQRIFGLVPKSPDDMDCAMQGIDRFEEFMKSIGCPTSLSEIGIGDELFSRYADDILFLAKDENGHLPGRPAMNRDDILELLRASL